MIGVGLHAGVPLGDSVVLAREFGVDPESWSGLGDISSQLVVRLFSSWDIWMKRVDVEVSDGCGLSGFLSEPGLRDGASDVHILHGWCL